MAEMTRREYWRKNIELKQRVMDLERELGIKKKRELKWRLKSAWAAFWRELAK